MPRSICKIPSCDGLVNGHGLCGKHYIRWRRYGDPLGGERNHAPPSVRFWRRVERRGPSECWPWTGAALSSGYGSFQPGGHRTPSVGAHRFSYAMHYGDIPSGMFVMHACDNKRCVNPAHLSLGTPKHNTADMIAKGRHARMAPVGTDNGKAKLDADGVRFIRANPQMSNAKLAAVLGVGASTIQGVRSGRTWAHVT
jgi:DNA-binding transcriptional regulator YiaG